MSAPKADDRYGLLAWRLGALYGGTAVALGAFGAHALESMLEDPSRLDVWETAARYQLVHAVVLLVLASLGRIGLRTLVLLGAGVAVFSGSLYLLVLTGQSWLGAITPLGGLSLICGWISLGLTPPQRPGPGTPPTASETP